MPSDQLPITASSVDGDATGEHLTAAAPMIEESVLADLRSRISNLRRLDLPAADGVVAWR